MEVGHDVKAILVTHVDDLCWAMKPEYDHHMKTILEAFVVNKEKLKEKEFRFCG